MFAKIDRSKTIMVADESGEKAGYSFEEMEAMYEQYHGPDSANPDRVSLFARTYLCAKIDCCILLSALLGLL